MIVALVMWRRGKAAETAVCVSIVETNAAFAPLLLCSQVWCSADEKSNYVTLLIFLDYSLVDELQKLLIIQCRFQISFNLHTVQCIWSKQLLTPTHMLTNTVCHRSGGTITLHKASMETVASRLYSMYVCAVWKNNQAGKREQICRICVISSCYIECVKLKEK